MLTDNLILYRIGQFIACALPLKIAYKFASLVSSLYYLCAKEDRANVGANLRVIFPQKNSAEIIKIKKKLFRNFAKYLVDFFRFQKLDKNFLKKKLHIENLHYIDRALSRGKGAIILSAHIGSWELGGVMMGILGYPMWAVTLTHKDKRVNEFFNYQRESKGMKVIPFGRAARQCLNELRANQLIALVGDRNFSANGLIIDFFAKKTLLPEGPALLTLKTDCQIIPGFTVRNDDDSVTLRFEKPVEFVPTGERENDAKSLISKYIIIIEDYIRKYPEQWFMFKKFWIE